jgi:hypothetical protein
MLHLIAQIIVRGLEAKTLCLPHIGFLHDQSIDGLRQNEGLELFGNVLALHHVSRYLIHFLNGDVLAVHLGNGIGADSAAGKITKHSARDKGDNHHDADDGEETDQKDFLKSAGGLQESNHLPMGSGKVKGECLIIDQRHELPESGLGNGDGAVQFGPIRWLEGARSAE